LRDRAPELFAAGQPAGYEHTVATVWSLAFTELGERPLARELAWVCAHVAPERIPRELLDAYSDVSGDPQVTAWAVDDAVELLLGYALLSATGDSTFAMHRLVQDVARSTGGGTMCAAAAARAVTLVDEVLPARPWEHEQWLACMRLLEHALSATSHAERHNVAPAATARVLARAGQYRNARADYPTARDLLQRAVAIIEAVHGPEHPDVALALGSLGVVQDNLGEPEAARATQERALAIKEVAYGPKHPEVAITLGNLGIVQGQLGDLEAARVTQERALVINEAVYGREHPEVGRTLGNLGNVHKRLGELAMAREIFDRVLTIFESVYGSEHPEVALALANMGVVQHQLGEFDKARECLARALAIFERFLGSDHPAARQAQECLTAWERTS
jgi:tetratricopeptide (TPR) repeat protein